MAELLKKNEDGISTLFYLQKIYPGMLSITNALEFYAHISKISVMQNVLILQFLFGCDNLIIENC